MTGSFLEMKTSGGSAYFGDRLEVHHDGRIIFTREGGVAQHGSIEHDFLAVLSDLAKQTADLDRATRLQPACASCDSTMVEVLLNGRPLIKTSGLAEGSAERLVEALEHIVRAFPSG